MAEPTIEVEPEDQPEVVVEPQPDDQPKPGDAPNTGLNTSEDFNGPAETP